MKLGAEGAPSRQRRLTEGLLLLSEMLAAMNPVGPDRWAGRSDDGAPGGRTLPEALCGDRLRLFLDLGMVIHVVEVRLNGKPLGVVWTAPWRVEITGAVMTAGNSLEIDVVNLWPNRLIGDAGLPAEKCFTKTNVAFDKRTPLLESGLFGPVVICPAAGTKTSDRTEH